MRPLLLGVLAVVGVLASCTQAPPRYAPDPPTTERMALAPATTAGQVIRVVDGDTVHVQVDGVNVTVRVLGLDTPETVDPRKGVQCWGPEASANAKRLLSGRRVTLVADPTQADKDRYGRVLRYIRLGGRDYTLDAVSAGMGRVYTYGRKPVLEYPELEEAQRQAMAAGRGLWSCPNPTPGD
jgi:micrococcal nuclease